MEDLFGFSTLNENHELCSDRNEKVIRKKKIETLKINEEDQRSDEFGFFVNLDIIHNLKETGIKNNDVKYQLEHQT